MNIIELSKYILHEYSQKSSDGITPMKLQKLLFYIKVWTLVSGNSLVAENFEHWDYGPVNREVYNYYKENGSKALKADEYATLELSESEKELINFIVENYISFDAITLSTMTHQEKPWKKTIKNEVITDESIEEYYRKQRFAKNFENPLDLYDKPFYTLKNYSLELDMEEEDAEEISTYVSYKEYKKQLEEVREDFDSLFNIPVAI